MRGVPVSGDPWQASIGGNGTVPGVDDGEETPPEYPKMTNGEDAPFRPSERPDIRSAPRRQHILDRHARGGTDGTQYPEEWTDEMIDEAIDFVLLQPGSIVPRGQFINFYGTFDGRRINVRLMRSTLRIETAPPVEGPGITRNGNPLPLGTTRYSGVTWNRGR